MIQGDVAPLEIAIFSRDAFISRSVTFPWTRFSRVARGQRTGIEPPKNKKRRNAEKCDIADEGKRKIRNTPEEKGENWNWDSFSDDWWINENMKFNDDV